jgi:hypothetical protein
MSVDLFLVYLHRTFETLPRRIQFTSLLVD